MAYELADLNGQELSVALSEGTDRALGLHVHKPGRQEDLAFAYWKPSRGQRRLSAVIETIVWPREDERILSGNVSFLPQYLERTLRERPAGTGIALIHGHLGPGWQAMSRDDVIAERDRLAGAVAGRTDLPLVGMTRGTDGAWSARFWARSAPRTWQRLWADTTRTVGGALNVTRNPVHREPRSQDAQVATISVWGERAQRDLASTAVGIVGLGSVGSLVAEALARSGVTRITLIDHDVIETRNLDRTAGAVRRDVAAKRSKVDVAARNLKASATAADFVVHPVQASLLSVEGLRAALDCDVLFSCVDRPLPRHVLNSIAYAHLIPVIDGGILARVRPDGRPSHIDWRMHAVGPGRACLACLGALRRSDVALDRDGLLDDPDYIANLSDADSALVSRRNVFAFSMSVAAHEVIQFAGLVTGSPRVSPVQPQRYHAYPGRMDIDVGTMCEPDCEYAALLGSAIDPTIGLPDGRRRY